MYKVSKHTCRAIVLLIKPFVWWRSRCRRRRGLLKLPKEFSAERSSFEASEWLAVCGSFRLSVVIVYRPTYSSEHPVTTSVFFHEFSVYLASLVVCNEFKICDDFNIHMDVPSDADTIRLKDLLKSMGLVRSPSSGRACQRTHAHTWPHLRNNYYMAGWWYCGRWTPSWEIFLWPCCRHM